MAFKLPIFYNFDLKEQNLRWKLSFNSGFGRKDNTDLNSMDKAIILYFFCIVFRFRDPDKSFSFLKLTLWLINNYARFLLALERYLLLMRFSLVENNSLYKIFIFLLFSSFIKDKLKNQLRNKNLTKLKVNKLRIEFEFLPCQKQ